LIRSYQRSTVDPSGLMVKKYLCIGVQKRQNVAPPEGFFFSVVTKLAICIVSFPNQLDQGISILLYNLWKCFRSRASLCVWRLSTPRPPSSLGWQNISQATFGGPFALMSAPHQRQCFIHLSICLTTIFGSLRFVNVLPPIACHGGTRDSCSGLGGCGTQQWTQETVDLYWFRLSTVIE
jgi:hypothetical protein